MPFPGETRFETNKGDKKRRVKNGGWEEAYGRELTETDLLEGIVAAGVSVLSENPAAFNAWVAQLVRESVAVFAANIRQRFTEVAQQQAQRLAERILRSLLRGRREGVDFLRIQDIHFKAGVSGYNGHNQVWVPNFSREGGFWQTTTSTLAFQPYVAMRLVPGGTSPGGDSGQSPNDYISDAWDDGYDITCFDYQSNSEWAVVMSRGPLALQRWRTANEYPNDWISQAFQDGYYLTNLSCNSGRWAVVASKGTRYTAQWRQRDANFPTDWINEKYNDGLHITDLTHGDGKWHVVMHGNTGFTQQRYQTASSYPSDWIGDLFDEGYRLTALSGEAGRWVAVMTKNSGFTSQNRIATADPATFITNHWEQGKRLTQLFRRDGKVYTVMMGGTQYGAQRYRYI